VATGAKFLQIKYKDLIYALRGSPEGFREMSRCFLLTTFINAAFVMGFLLFYTSPPGIAPTYSSSR
jgi:hypothetical protein